MSHVQRRPEHDVIIVGASVAGCRAALTLARHGVRTLLLDRASFPRWKPCAGGLTPKTRPYLPGALFDLVECSVQSAHITFGDEYVTRVQSQEPLGWMVHRESFDQLHLELAGSQPTVDVMLGTAVRAVEEHAAGVVLETDGGDLEARAVVGADGAKSMVSRFLPGHDQRMLGFAYEGEVGPLSDEPPGPGETLFDFRRIPHGYGWVFPKKDHYSVGGFVYAEKLPGVKGIFEGFRAEIGPLRNTKTYRARGHPVSLGGSLRRLNTNRIVLAGEAGGLVDPLTGEGIYYALRSGHLAGEALAGFLSRERSLDAYGNQVRREIQEELRVARRLADLIYNHPRASFRLLLQNSLLCQWFTEVGLGTKTYKGLLGEALRKIPVLPFHAGISRRMEVQV